MSAYKYKASIIAVAAITLIIVTYYVSSEQNIYFWDYNGYWRFWQDFGAQFSHHPLEALTDVQKSIAHDDYNIFPVAITAIFGLLPLPSRLAYILSLFFCYFIPSVVIFSLICRRFSGDFSLTAKALSLLLVATFSAFWAPTLRGYPDICGLIFIMLSVLYCANNDLSIPKKVKQGIILGGMLWAPFLMRRWYAYTIVSLYLSLPVLNFLLHAKGNYSTRRAWHLLLTFFIAGTTSCVLAVTFQGPLLKRIVSTNYSYIYSAYQSGFIYSIENLLKFSGPYLLPLLLFGFFTASLGSNKPQRTFVLFCLFNLFFSFLLFTRTQSPGMQHIMPFAMWGLFIVGQGLLWLLGKIRQQSSQWGMVTLVSVVALFILLHTLFGFKLPQVVNKILPVETLPMQVDNYPNYLALEKTIAKLTENGDKVTVFSSNNVLNEEMLNTLSHRQLENRIAYTSQVDLRDGINFNALKSRYVIVTNPVQIHLHTDGQRVISQPVQAILNRQNIGQAFERMQYEYKLSSGVSAWIYQRVRPFTKLEIHDFLQDLYLYHPQWKAIYPQDIISAAMSAKVKNGDIWGGFYVNNDGVIYAHPGENTPTQVTWLLSNIKQLRITSINTNCNQQDTVKVTISAPGLPSAQVEVPKGQDVLLNVTPWQGILSTLSISKNHASGCDALSITGNE